MVSSDANKPFLHNPPKSSIFALAYHDAFLLSSFFPFHVYVEENLPFREGQTFHLFT